MARTAKAPTNGVREDAAGPIARRRYVVALEIAIGALAVLFLLLAAGGLYLYSLSRSLPDLDIKAASFKTPRTSVVYAADGSVLAEWHGAEDRHVVGIEDVARSMRDAVVAAEDPNFYEHDGVDWAAIARGMRASGARNTSTITQQLVKLLFPRSDRSIGRKVQEALLAYQLETKSDKSRVLETYLNLAYFGHGAYGVESAARTYFGKSASDLTTAEAAMLAGVIRSPVRYSPRSNPQTAKARRDEVLETMREQGVITSAEEAEAIRVAIKTIPPKDAASVAPYFVEYVKQDLLARLGADVVFNGGLRVRTTLDRSLQASAERAARSVLGGRTDPDVAIVTIEPKTGHVLAMVGGRDFRTDQFNLAVQGKRQPGSAFKPFVLVTALEKGARPDEIMDARPYSVRVKDGVWKVDNYENASTAPSVSLRAATAWSVNAVYARLIMRVGPQAVVDTAKKMGITSPLDPDPAIALGGLKYGVSPLEMASAYATLANGGLRIAPSGVREVTDPDGKVLFAPKADPERAVPADIARTAADMLHGVVEQGTGTSARTGHWSAGKTGTTQSYRDAWFVGWEEGLTTSVWVGYAKGQVPMLDVHGIKVTGGSYPAMIWSGIMTGAGGGAGSPGAVASAGSGPLVLTRVCADTLQLANPRCPNVVEMYLSSANAPRQRCTKH